MSATISLNMSSYQLEIHRHDRPVETREFDAAKVVIGRESGDLVLHDPEVSSRHGELVFSGDEVTFVDLNSTNGTFDATGARIREPKALIVGSALRMGRTTILLTRVGQPVVPNLPAGKTIFAPGGIPRPPGLVPPGPLAAAPSTPASVAGVAPTDVAPSLASPSLASPSRLPPPASVGPVSLPKPSTLAPPGGSTPPTRSVSGTEMLPPRPTAGPEIGPPRSSATATGPHAGLDTASAGTAATIARDRLLTPVVEAGGSQVGKLPPPSGFATTTAKQSVFPPADPLADTVDPGPATPPGAMAGAHEQPPFAASSKTASPAPAFGANLVATSPGDSVGDEIRGGWTLLLPHLAKALFPLAVLAVGGALVDLLLGWIPMVGSLAGLLVAGVSLVVGPLAYGVLFYVLIKAHLGQHVELRDAWMAVYRRADKVWTNLFVAGLIASVGACFLIVPGIALGFFIGPVFFVEERRFLDINFGALDHFKRRAVQILLICLAVGLGMLVVYWPSGVLTAMGGVFGIMGRLVGVAAAAVGCLGTGLVAAVAVRMYFRLRGDEAIEQASASLAAFEGSTVAPSSAPSADA